MLQKALPSHTHSILWIGTCISMFTCITFVLASVLAAVPACVSVFESPPCHSIRMDDPEQTYSISSPDFREDALDDMLCRIHLQSDDTDFLEQEGERDQLQ